MVPITVSTKILAAVAAILLTGFASAARAATVTYNFTGATTAYSQDKVFTAGTGPNLTVSAYTVTTDGLTTTPVNLAGYGVGQWTGLGLGLLDGPGDTSHTVDGSGLNDLLVLAFASSVKLVSATFNYAGYLTNSNDNFAFFASPNNDGSVAGNMIFSSQDIAGSVGKVDGASGPYSGSYNFTTDLFGGDFASKVFGIGAIYDAVVSCGYHCSKTVFDSFKLASVTVSTGPFDTPPEVPLPAGLILLLSGLAGLGFIGRAKNKAYKTPA